MQVPDFLPEHLLVYCSCAHPKELTAALANRPEDFVSFFTYACKDITWAAAFPEWLGMAVRWAAKAYYLKQLSVYDAKRFVETIQIHYSQLQGHLFFRPALFLTISLEAEGREIVGNSLLFGVMSPFFRELFESTYGQWKDLVSFPQLSFHWLERVKTYVEQGTIPDLWRESEEELFAFMRQAKMWQLFALEKECASILKRYLTRENVLAHLLGAHERFEEAWKEECRLFFNRLEQGWKLLEAPLVDFRLTIEHLRQEALDLFPLLSPVVTHLGCFPQLPVDPMFENMVRESPKLVGIDLSSVVEFHNWSIFPEHLEELRLGCLPWLEVSDIREIACRYPHIKTLSLAGNGHLNALFFAELYRFAELLSLDLSECPQLQMADFRVLVQGLPQLHELHLRGCVRLTDAAMGELTHHLPHIRSLSLERCHEITDRTVQEIGMRLPRLVKLSLKHCFRITEKSVVRLLHTQPNFEEIDIEGIALSPSEKLRLERHFPRLRLLG